MKTEQVKNVQEEPVVLKESVDQAKTDDFQNRLPEFGGGLADSILKFDASVNGILKVDASGNKILQVTASGNQ
jgi:hypothetical protein